MMLFINGLFWSHSLSTHTSNNPSIYLSTTMIHPSINPSIQPTLHHFIHLSIKPSIHPFIHPSVYLLATNLSIHSSIHLLLIHPSMKPSIHPFIYYPFIHLLSSYPSIHIPTYQSIYCPLIYSFIHPSKPLSFQWKFWSLTLIIFFQNTKYIILWNLVHLYARMNNN